MGMLHRAVEFISEQTWLDGFAESLQVTIGDVFDRAGETGQQAKNFLSGTRLGHPLHPVLTDLPIGFWGSSVVLDVLDTMGVRKTRGGADATLAAGTASAMLTGLAGWSDWQHTHDRARRIGLVHGLMNVSATLMFLYSMLLRMRGRRWKARGVSMMTFGALQFSAYLGGSLVYKERLGVSHANEEELPEEFVPVMREADLPERQPTKVEVEGTEVVLVRMNGTISALAGRCSHLGGPLAEGELEEDSIVCPWHHSKFHVTDGEPVQGPSAFQQPTLDLRVRNGQIEVRRAEHEAS